MRSLRRFSSNDLLSGVLADVVLLGRTLSWSDEVFAEAYDYLETALYSTELESLLIIPLRGLRSLPHAPIELDGGLALDAMTDSEMSAALTAGLVLTLGGNDFAAVSYPFAIRIPFSEPKRITHESDLEPGAFEGEAARRELADRLIMTLRLLKGGRIGPTGSLTLDDNLFFSGQTSWGPAPGGELRGNEYELSEQDLAELRSLWRLVNEDAIRTTGPLMAACRRFGYADERARDDDRLVDLMIAAESLFLSDSAADRGELSFRLSLRAARFVEAEDASCTAIFDVFRRAYRV